MKPDYILEVSKERSSFIKKLEYDETNRTLGVHVRPYEAVLYYEKIPLKVFEEFTKQHSIGKYYLHFIKSNFKQIFMANEEKRKPKGVNNAKDEVRWIDFSLDVTKINKDWLVQGKSGVYLNGKLRMLPDGKVDEYGCLGFMAQSVPSDVYKAAEAKEKGSGKKLEGIILGNAKELVWGERNEENVPGNTGAASGIDTEVSDDLPF